MKCVTIKSREQRNGSWFAQTVGIPVAVSSSSILSEEAAVRQCALYHWFRTTSRIRLGEKTINRVSLAKQADGNWEAKLTKA